MVKQKLKAKALLIDLDGTLVDSLEAFAEAAKTALSTVNQPHSSEKVGLEMARHLQRNLPINEFFNKIDIDKALREKFLESFLQSFHSIAPNKTKLFPNVDKTLYRLSRKFPLALITRRQVSKELVREELERLHLDRYFTTIITALDVEKPTPSPDAILKAADKLQVSTENCVVVSDSGIDIQAAKSAGAKTIAVLSGLFKKEELKKETPNLIVRDVNQLPEHLQAM